MAELNEIVFYNLQLGPAGTQIKSPPTDLHLVDLAPYLTDFTQTVAVLQRLDVLITIDSAPLHLSASLGIPTWGLLFWVADWRWLDREESPWYSSLRLFRQSRRGDWAGVMQRVVAALREWQKFRNGPRETVPELWQRALDYEQPGRMSEMETVGHMLSTHFAKIRVVIFPPVDVSCV